MCDPVPVKAVDGVAAAAERGATAELWRPAAARKLRALPHGVDGYLDLSARLPLQEAEREVADDVHRSFSALPSGLRPPPAALGDAELVLSRVLRAWVCRSLVEGLGTGYVQGMGFVAALAVAVFGAAGEAEAFGLLCLMLEEILTPSLYARWPPLAGCDAAAQLAASACQRVFPPAVLAASGTREVCVMLCVRWLLCAFVGVLPAAPLLRAWTAALSAADPCAPWHGGALLRAAAERAGEPPPSAAAPGAQAHCDPSQSPASPSGDSSGAPPPPAPAPPAPRRGTLPLMLMVQWAAAVIAHRAPEAAAAAAAASQSQAALMTPAHQVFRHISAATRALPDDFEPPAAECTQEVLQGLLGRYDDLLLQQRAELADAAEAEAEAAEAAEQHEETLREHLTGCVSEDLDFETWVESLPAWGLGAASAGLERLRRRVWRDVTGRPTVPPPASRRRAALRHRLKSRLSAQGSRLHGAFAGALRRSPPQGPRKQPPAAAETAAVAPAPYESRTPPGPSTPSRGPPTPSERAAVRLPGDSSIEQRLRKLDALISETLAVTAPDSGLTPRRDRSPASPAPGDPGEGASGGKRRWLRALKGVRRPGTPPRPAAAGPEGAAAASPQPPPVLPLQTLFADAAPGAGAAPGRRASASGGSGLAAAEEAPPIVPLEALFSEP